MISPRQCFFIIAAICGAMITAALYMQHVMGLEPCYLCIVQRVFVIATGVVALIAALHNPGRRGRIVYSSATSLTALTGSGFSIRQLYLQSLPEDLVPACGPPANYLMDSFSFSEWLPILLKGDGNCAKVDWTFLGLSIAGWTMLGFFALAIFAIWQAFRRSS